MLNKIISVFLFFGLIWGNILAQESTSTLPKVSATYAEYLGTTPPVRDLLKLSPTSLERKRLARKDQKIPKNFIGRGTSKVVRPELEHQGPDPIRQRFFTPQPKQNVEPLVNVDGITIGSSPNDPSGDIGLDHYVQAINVTTIGVFDKEGNLLESFAANTLWNTIGFASAGDPIVLYDQEFDRWIITEFPSGNQLLIAVSETEDPLGSYAAYNFATPIFPDYPKYGIWNNAYTVTTNEGAGALACYLIDRAALLGGEATVPIQRVELPGNTNTETGFFVATPVDWTGFTAPSSDPTFLILDDSAWGQAAEDQINIFTIKVDFSNPANTSFESSSVVVTPFDSNPCSASGFGFACIPQRDGSGLDGIPEVIMNQPHYRNFGTHESIVCTFITDVTDGDNLSGIRWIEFRKTDADWFLYQEGTVAPEDGLHRFMPSICMDGSGNIGLAYNVSSPDIYVGVRFTGRLSSDTLGQMTVPEFTVVEGQNTVSQGGDRFGDYAHMSIDPTNDRVFWYTTEYANTANGGDVRTRIVAFQLQIDTVDLAPKALLSPVDAPELTANETVQIEVTNQGLDTIDSFTVGYIFEDEAPVFDEIDQILLPDSSYLHTFIPTVDLSTIGSYTFKIFTDLAGDEAPFNDTLIRRVNHLPRFDAGIREVAGIGPLACTDTLLVDLTIQNFGADTLTSLLITYFLNDNEVDVIAWSGVLPPDKREQVTLPIYGFQDGPNPFRIELSNPNGVMDQNIENNSFTRPIPYLSNGVEISLNLRTDQYPGEITWQVLDEQENVIYTGGPYEQGNASLTEVWCLDPDACYTFSIQDAFGDGICCGYGQGNYTITDENGIELFASDGNYGPGEINDFCARFMCMLTANLDISPESAVGLADGAILITTQNGVGPFQYSIDGGVTFQEEPIFNGLTAGDYAIVVTGAVDCLYEDTVSVETCVLDYTLEVQNEVGSGEMNGSITVNIANGTPPYQYSIDGGDNFQNENEFGNLATGEYPIVVQDGLGCSVADTVLVDFQTNATEIISGEWIEVFPNPTSGIFSLQVKGLKQASVFLGIELYNANGKRVQSTSLTRYDNTFVGQVSLVHYPAGIYFVRFLSKDIQRLVKVIKE